MRVQRSAVTQAGQDVLVAIRVQPRAAHNQLLTQLPDRFTVRLTAPPVEGAANAACRAFLAELLDLPKSRLVLVSGETSRHKLLRIEDADAARVLARLRAVARPQK